jgi:hypothetical protein
MWMHEYDNKHKNQIVKNTTNLQAYKAISKIKLSTFTVVDARWHFIWTLANDAWHFRKHRDAF